MANILCVTDVETPDRDELIAIAKDHTILFRSNETATEQELRTADILYGMPTQDMLRQAENLKWLQATNAGIEKYLPLDVTRKEAIITNASGFFTEALCESAIGMLLLLMKKFPQYIDNQKNRIWHDEDATASITGSKAMVVGFGAAGMSIGRVLHAFGAKVYGVRRQNLDVPSFAEAVITPDKMPELLPEMDIIMLALPHTQLTDRLFDEELFGFVKRGAYLVNIGRGKTVDQDALVQALQNGTICGAGLDVFTVEPLPKEHPLWSMENVFITPHVAGRDYMPLALKRNIALFKENLKRYLDGKELLNIVDRDIGYNAYYRAGGQL